jgi:T5orf172 domain
VEKQIVYVLINEAMPNLVKIGKTTRSDVQVRMNELYSSGVPKPFKCIMAVEVEDCSKVETALHIAFGPGRINPKREFFEIDPEQAIAVLKLLSNNDVTPLVNTDLNLNVSDAERATTIKGNRRPPLDYIDMNIPIGSTLVYTEDESILVEVATNKKVKYNDEMLSLTKVTQELLELDYAVQPTRFWMFEGKSLKAIYDDTYSLDDL